MHPSLQGLTQYSGDPQTEWDLNAFGTKEEVLAAIRGLRYRGGNTFTGLPGPRDPTLGGLLRSVLMPLTPSYGSPSQSCSV